VTEIDGLAALRPGDLMFGPIGGLAGLGVGLGQLALREGVRVGRLSVRHVGVVVEASRHLPPGAAQDTVTREWYPDGAPTGGLVDGRAYVEYPTGVYTRPKLAQAMPGGAEVIEMTDASHWTDRHAYVRLPEDYPGQAEDAAAIARLMEAEGVGYSWSSYAALAAWRWGIKTPRLERWIGRRRAPLSVRNGWGRAGWDRSAGADTVQLPCEAICSVFADQAWSLAGKRVMHGTVPQVVTPGAMAMQLWRRPDVVWGGPGLL
jgi:hypothetical protein